MVSFCCLLRMAHLPESSLIVLSVATCCLPAICLPITRVWHNTSNILPLTSWLLANFAVVQWLKTQDVWESQRDDFCLQWALCFAAMNIYHKATWPPLFTYGYLFLATVSERMLSSHSCSQLVFIPYYQVLHCVVVVGWGIINSKNIWRWRRKEKCECTHKRPNQMSNKTDCRAAVEFGGCLYEAGKILCNPLSW